MSLTVKRILISLLLMPLGYILSFMPYYTYDYFWDDNDISVSEIQHILAVCYPIALTIILTIWSTKVVSKLSFFTFSYLIIIALYYLFMTIHPFLMGIFIKDMQGLIAYSMTTGMTVVFSFKMFLLVLPYLLIRNFYHVNIRSFICNNTDTE